MPTNRYTVGIELHGQPSEADYDRLHAEMESRGFSREIEGDDGTRWHLPPAEYNYLGGADVERVHQLALAAVQTTDRRDAVLVSQSVRRIWSGLRPLGH